MRLLYLDFLESLHRVNKLALVFILIQFTNALGFLPRISDSIGYLVMFIMSVYTLLKSRGVCLGMLFLVIYLGCNIIICSPDAIFKSWLRLAFLIVLLVVVSPLVQSCYLRKLRKDMLNVTLWIASVLSVASFFCRFLGINFMYASANSDYNTAGTFAGLFNQSMMLGPVASISAVFCAYKAFECDKRNTKRLYMIASLLCFAAVFFSASRSSLLCAVVGLYVMFQKLINNRRRFLKAIIYVLVVASVTFPLWIGLTDGVIEKNISNIEAGSSISSREKKWNARIDEFNSSQLFGIGFASVDPVYDDVGINGTIEPGTSWLAVLSMTGVLGFILFFYVFRSGYLVCRRMHKKDDALLVGLLVLFAVHMIAEGYVFAAGSFLCFLLWLVIGCCVDRNYDGYL